MKKVLIVIGTRPEAIKMAPLIIRFKKDTSNFNVKVCVTEQHKELLDQVLSFFQIKTDYNLNIMKTGQNLYEITAKILLRIRPLLEDFAPDLVLVHGDTSTTFATSLAAYYKKIKIGHIEAGLRTNNIYSPWPEEGNRRLTGVIADYHFSPTENSQKNLLNEGVKKSSIFVTGNTVIDALTFVLNRINSDRSLKLNIEKKIIKSGFKEIHSKFILITGHRRENFGEGFLNICKALKVLAKDNSNIYIVFPVHLNPNVRKPVVELLSKIDNIKLLKPFQYEEFVYLMSRSYLILTDSGGIQEEAPSLGKPVLVMRDTTERPEAVEAGTVKLVGSNQFKIVKEVQKLLNDKSKYEKMCKIHNPYGNGNATEKILNIIRN